MSIDLTHLWSYSWWVEEWGENRKTSIFASLTKAFDYVDHNKPWKILKEMGIPDHLTYLLRNLSVQFSSVAQSCPTLCNSMNRSTPGLPVHHQLPEFIQTHVHWVDDAIQPSHPLLSPSSPAPNPSQHLGLFRWVNLHLLKHLWHLLS